MCTPRLRWIPEHCMQIKIPKFTLAHLGPLHINKQQFIQIKTAFATWMHQPPFNSKLSYTLDVIIQIRVRNANVHLLELSRTYLALQSAHSLFSGNFNSPSRICICLSHGKDQIKEEKDKVKALSKQFDNLLGYTCIFYVCCQ